MVGGCVLIFFFLPPMNCLEKGPTGEMFIVYFIILLVFHFANWGQE